MFCNKFFETKMTSQVINTSLRSRDPVPEFKMVFANNDPWLYDF